MKFITLTKSNTNKKLLIHPMMITALDELYTTVDTGPKTAIHVMGADYWSVKETVEEIQKLIKESENIHTITWDTGPK